MALWRNGLSPRIPGVLHKFKFGNKEPPRVNAAWLKLIVPGILWTFIQIL